MKGWCWLLGCMNIEEGDCDWREAVAVAIGGACYDGEEAAIEALSTIKK